jgi:hypothetical protein
MIVMQQIEDCGDLAQIQMPEPWLGRSAKAIVDDAKMMLETVMRLYYARHGFELYDPWIAFALKIIGN